MNPDSTPPEKCSPTSVAGSVLDGVIDLLGACRVAFEATRGTSMGAVGASSEGFQESSGAVIDGADSGGFREAVLDSRTQEQAAAASWMVFFGARARPLEGAETSCLCLSRAPQPDSAEVLASTPEAQTASPIQKVFLAPVVCGPEFRADTPARWNEAVHTALLALAAVGSLPVAMILRPPRPCAEEGGAAVIVDAWVNACRHHGLESLAMNASEPELSGDPGKVQFGVIGIPPDQDCVQPPGMPAAGDALVMLGGNPDGNFVSVEPEPGWKELLTAVRMMVHGGRVRRVFPVTRQGLAVAAGAACFDPVTSRWNGVEIHSPDAAPPASEQASAASSDPGATHPPPVPTPLFPLEDFFNNRFAGCALVVVGGLDAGKIMVQSRLLGVGAVLLGRFGGDLLQFQSGSSTRVWDGAGTPVTQPPPVGDVPVGR